MLSIAESLLEEAQLKTFTWCDPDDASAATAQSAVVGATGCSATVEVLGPETIAGITESRTSNTVPFDNVNDYNGLVLASPIASVTGGAFAPDGYSASVVVAKDGTLGRADAKVPEAAALRITVTVTHGNDSLVLVGYRTRYAPNSLP